MVFTTAGGGATQETGYDIDNSLRFAHGDSPKLQRRVSSTGSNKVGTFSIWFKRGAIRDSNNLFLFSAHEGTQNYINVGINDADKFQIRAVRDNSEALKYRTNALFRDHSAFYNVVFSLDTAESDGNNAMKLYINGALQSAYSISTYTQNMEIMFNLNANYIRVGAKNDDSEPFDGYISEMHYVDGTVKQASDFGEYNDNGVWIPKKYDGSYGTNGFYLEFKQSGVGSGSTSTVGADTSGNTNHFDSTNIAATDQTTDTPTNNFCTLNPLDPVQGAVYSEGNCKTVTNSSNRNYVTGTFGLTSGKWYWEAKLTAVTSNATDQAFFGIADLDDRGVDSTGQSLGDRANEVGWHQEEGKYQRNNSWSSAHTASWGIGDICAIALDADNNRVTIAKNGQWADGSGNADESSPTAFVTYTASTMTPAMGEGGGGTEATWECNFGNSAFSISSGNSDANGYGNFEYAVPSGYYALCTKNLATYG